MKIIEFLNGQSINSFAKNKGLSPTTVWRAVQGKVISPSKAKAISDATCGAVTTDELLYPDAVSDMNA